MCSVIIRGATAAVAEECGRALHDAFCIVVEADRVRRVVPGGGAVQFAAAALIRLVSRSGTHAHPCSHPTDNSVVKSKVRLVLETFASALEVIPRTLADNGGFDTSELISTARFIHDNALAALSPPQFVAETASLDQWASYCAGVAFSRVGVDAVEGEVVDMYSEANVWEVVSVTRAIMRFATEVSFSCAVVHGEANGIHRLLSKSC